jgi:hypothetical protein
VDTDYLDKASYLTADYERSRFYLSQCRFDSNASERIVVILSVNSTTPESGAGASLSTGAIAGISVGIVLAVLALATVIFLIFRRRRRAKQAPRAAMEAYPPDKPEDGAKPELDAQDTAYPGHEICGTAIEFYKPDKYEPLMEGSPLTPPPPPPEPKPIYEMTGEGINLPELPASTGRDEGSSKKGNTNGK